MLRGFSRNTILKFRRQRNTRHIIKFTQNKENTKKTNTDIKEKGVSSYIPAK